jgi:tRNA(Arg) A34 adenosine deaminase TadA
MDHPNKKIMKQVLKYAETKKSVAAFIVKDDKIISKAICTIFTGPSPIPTRHAEINAIEKACKKLKKEYLDDCWLYSSLECCPMCASACCWARLKGVVYSANGCDRRKNEWFEDWIFIAPEEVFKKYKYSPKLVKNFMRDEGKKAINWD